MDDVPGTVLLSGVVGSQAYGLATAESDTDRLGLFALPTERLHGLKKPVARNPSWAQSELDTYEELFRSTRSVLPEEPDPRPVEEWLLMVRRSFFP